MPALDDLSQNTAVLALPLPIGDVGETLGTASSISLGRSVYGTIGASGDLDWYAITLVAGQTYDFRLGGVGRTPLPDTYISLLDSTGAVLGVNDDAGGEVGYNSMLVFTATTTGTYYISARGFGTNTGDFLLTAVNHNSAGLVLTADEVAWQLTNNFERYFSGAGSANIPATAYDLSGGRQISYNVTGLTAPGAALAQQALQMWSDVTGITFQQTSGAAQITFQNDSVDVEAFNSNVTSPDGTIISSTLQVSTGWLTTFGTTMDSYSFETYVHELGHSLGLGHGGNYNGSATYGVDNYYLNDSPHLSIMSYMQAVNDEFDDANTFVNAQFRYVLTPMIADILAMRNLYGLSTTTRTGNTTYGYNSNTGNAALDAAVTLNDPANNNYVAFTVFDNGGTDTINLSGYSGSQRIDLNQGASSDVLGGRLNMGIAYGTVVENAIGGSAADSMTGNSAANSLSGLGGNDTLNGNTGVDTLIGGLGDDVYVTDGGDIIVEAAAAGTDRVMSSASASLSANIENLTLTGAAAINAYGNALNNVITGNSANNVLSGGGGNDTLNGTTGTDTMIGGLGDDVYTTDGGDTLTEAAAAGTDRVMSSASYGLSVNLENLTLTGTAAINGYGNILNNIITGNSGNNVLGGGNGNDTLNGTTGADTMIGGLGDDVYTTDGGDAITEAAAAGTDRVLSSASTSLSANVENLTLTGAAAINGYGNTLANQISGNSGNNVLNGGAGNDTLSGGAGADVFIFNTAPSAANIDRITDFAAVNDTIYLGSAVFAGLAAGGLAATAFASNLTGLATDALDRIIYESDTGRLMFDADGTGAGAGVQFGLLATSLTLTNGDFFVV
ncbi:M10 family metallopeptidase C-terminal domain-containing protein [Rhodobacter ferrooxidans]|uniref:Serralysin n=1 Tax=Rhodobacter ferrooxidans TaxID=371731 RepID=C8S4L5_9RHOB|nr:M10 family metallopeptidase C-terminal domain-containing protein [Rhodobacter sp. SW2]EEW24098.1 Serralysin [Rhodobacter sp. SW2]